jgi:hypothetical protein
LPLRSIAEFHNGPVAFFITSSKTYNSTVLVCLSDEARDVAFFADANLIKRKLPALLRKRFKNLEKLNCPLQIRDL